ncbi:MAG: hypothetical protein AMXMBFR64_53720 [Myxococcales bacterium]
MSPGGQGATRDVALYLIGVALCGLLTGCGATTPRRARPLPIPRTSPVPVTLEDALALRPEPDGPDTRSFRLRTAGGTWKTLYWQKGSASVGSPSNGSLSGGRAFPDWGPGWLRKGSRPWGTDEAVLLLAWAITEVGLNYPGTAPLVIGDFSQEGGGRVPPHRSHRSGRDVDVGLYAAGNEPVRGFKRLALDAIDYDKTWFLIERLLVTNEVQYVFVDYRIQGGLYEAALDAGWDEAALGSLFEHPRGVGAGGATIRHARGHDDHLHIRFRCPREDEDCIP